MKEPAVQSHRFATASILQFQADLVIEVIGHDLTNLRLGCEQVVQALQAVPQLGFVRATLQRGNPELTIKLDRDKLAALSLQAEATSRILRTKVLGDIPTMFVERERKIDMRVRVDRSEMDSEERLRAVNINPKGIPEIRCRRWRRSCAAKGRARSGGSATCAAPRCTPSCAALT